MFVIRNNITALLSFGKACCMFWAYSKQRVDAVAVLREFIVFFCKRGGGHALH